MARTKRPIHVTNTLPVIDDKSVNCAHHPLTKNRHTLMPGAEYAVKKHHVQEAACIGNQS